MNSIVINVWDGWVGVCGECWSVCPFIFVTPSVACSLHQPQPAPADFSLGGVTNRGCESLYY